MSGRLLRVVLDGRVEMLEFVIAELLEERAECLERGQRVGAVAVLGGCEVASECREDLIEVRDLAGDAELNGVGVSRVSRSRC